MRVEFSRLVECDIEAIGDYIALDNPRRAVSFVREIRATVRLVGREPLLFRLRPEIWEGARVAVMGRYVILFRVTSEVVRIERVVFGGRDLAVQFGLAGGE